MKKILYEATGKLYEVKDSIWRFRQFDNTSGKFVGKGLRMPSYIKLLGDSAWAIV